MAIEEGKPAPAFTLKDGDGRMVSLGDFSGKDVIVYFYPKDDTPGCTKEACGFRDAWKELQKRGVVVLGVSPDPSVSHQRFAAKYRLPFPLLSDPAKAVMEKYGAWGEKLMYGKKVVGVIRSLTPDDGGTSFAEGDVERLPHGSAHRSRRPGRVHHLDGAPAFRRARRGADAKGRGQSFPAARRAVVRDLG